MTSKTVNITDELCKICDGNIECAPTAILLISLVHTLYGHIGPEPDYFGENKEILMKPQKNVEENDAVEKNADPYDETANTRYQDDDNSQNENYDFIVVGGGTAGCVLASRLSENRKWTVLLVEAGPEEPKIALIPGLTSEFKGSSLDWQYRMRPKKGFCEDRGKLGCEIVQGKVLGGTSVINDLAYVRGNAADYDEWALNGNDGWSYQEVLPFFKYSEGNYDKDISKNCRYHSVHGPMDVGRYPYVDENVDVLLSAFNELGYNYTDINGKNQLGFMRIQSMSYYGERVSTYTAFIEPIRNVRSNINVVTEALVTKILFNTPQSRFLTAAGIEYVKNGTKVKVKINKEVILTAGAINSAKLLMQSGIGPKDYLQYLGIHVHHDISVGFNLHDHVSVCLPVISLSKTSTMTKFPEKLKDITAYYGKGVGPLSANFQVIAYLESNMSEVLGTPDFEIRFKGHNSNMYYDRIEVCVSLMTPRSRGHVVLNATDPVFGKPLIYPNYLKNPTDQKILLEGIQEIIKIFDTEVFKTAEYEFDPRPILNNECREFGNVSDDFWSCIIRHFSSPLHNYVGTCKMGPSNDYKAVVDHDLRVHRTKNLRVADASIIPKITRGPTAAPVIMIAEKASEIIKSTWYLS